MNHFNKLTPAEAERLALLAEECSEVIQIVNKILRHGYESAYTENGLANRELLEKEIGHVDAAVRLMIEGDDIIDDHIDNHRNIKLGKIQQYLHHQNHLPWYQICNPQVVLGNNIGAHLIMKENNQTETQCHNDAGKSPCCSRAGEYNGFGSDGPLTFHCDVPNGCTCHD